MVTKMCYVGDNFTRKPPKFERFIRPMALRAKRANVTHPELKTTFYLPIIGVKKNPSSPLYTSLGVITKGTIIEVRNPQLKFSRNPLECTLTLLRVFQVNVSDLGLVTPSGKVVWGKYAQVTNNPENEGCVNAVLIV